MGPAVRRSAVVLLAVAGLAAGEAPLAAELVVPGRLPADGQGVWVGIRLVPAPGWHTYWRNPGGSGMAPRLTWTLPPGWRAEAPAFPPPAVLAGPGIAYGYAGSTMLAVRLVPAAPTAGPLDLRLRLDALACREACVPVRRELSAVIPADASGRPLAPADAEAIAAATRPPAQVGAEAIRADARHLDLRFPWSGEAPRAVPEVDGWLDDDAPQAATATPDGWRLRLVLAAGAAIPERVDVLLIGGGRVARASCPAAIPRIPGVPP